MLRAGGRMLLTDLRGALRTLLRAPGSGAGPETVAIARLTPEAS